MIQMLEPKINYIVFKGCWIISFFANYVIRVFSVQKCLCFGNELLLFIKVDK